MSTSRNYRTEILADSLDCIDPTSGGQYGRQLRVTLCVSAVQRRGAILTMLSAMPEADVYALLASDYPALVAPSPVEWPPITGAVLTEADARADVDGAPRPESAA